MHIEIQTGMNLCGYLQGKKSNKKTEIHTMFYQMREIVTATCPSNVSLGPATLHTCTYRHTN